MKRAAKKDANHKAIVAELERIGCAVVDTSQLKNAFDCLVCYNGQSYIVEIKNPKYLPKQINRARLEKELSTGEYKCMQDIEKVGVPYHIITNIDEIKKIIGYEGR